MIKLEEFFWKLIEWMFCTCYILFVHILIIFFEVLLLMLLWGVEQILLDSFCRNLRWMFSYIILMQKKCIKITFITYYISWKKCQPDLGLIYAKLLCKDMTNTTTNWSKSCQIKFYSIETFFDIFEFGYNVQHISFVEFSYLKAELLPQLTFNATQIN